MMIEFICNKVQKEGQVGFDLFLNFCVLMNVWLRLLRLRDFLVCFVYEEEYFLVYF